MPTLTKIKNAQDLNHHKHIFDFIGLLKSQGLYKCCVRKTVHLHQWSRDLSHKKYFSPCLIAPFIRHYYLSTLYQFISGTSCPNPVAPLNQNRHMSKCLPRSHSFVEVEVENKGRMEKITVITLSSIAQNYFRWLVHLVL